MDYLDFEITIATTPSGGFTLTATCGDDSASDDFTLTLTEQELSAHLANIQIAVLVRSAKARLQLREAEQNIQTLGKTLFDALFTSPIRDLYRATRRRATSEGKRGVRLKLDIQEPRLAALPWEYLYHPGDQEFIGLSLQSPIIRTFPVATAAPIVFPRPLKILGMIANPHDQSPLDVQGEKQRLEDALRPLGNQVQLEWVVDGTLAALQEALEDGEWHIFHYIGHGGFDRSRDEGFLALEDGDGKTKPAYATQLYRLFQRGQGLQLAVLNSCDSARHSRNDLISAPAIALVRRGLPAVLAMQFAIPDAVAKALTSHFYRALARGRTLDYALSDARQTLTLNDIDSLEWGVPVLYMRSSRSIVETKAITKTIPASQPPAMDANATLWQELMEAEGKKEWDTVISVGELLLKRGYRTNETRPKLAKGYYQISINFYNVRQFDQAIIEINRAIDLDPDQANYYFQRGKSYHNFGDEIAPNSRSTIDYTKSISDKNRAVELNPHIADYYFERGYSYHEAAVWNFAVGDFTKAISDLNYAIYLNPNNADFYLVRGQSYHTAASQNHSAGDFAKAIQDYSKAIQLDPNNASLYYWRGTTYFLAADNKHPVGDRVKAVSDVSKAIELDPRKGEYHSIRAIIYSNMGKHAEAKRDKDKAKELGYPPG